MLLLRRRRRSSSTGNRKRMRLRRLLQRLGWVIRRRSGVVVSLQRRMVVGQPEARFRISSGRGGRRFSSITRGSRRSIRNLGRLWRGTVVRGRRRAVRSHAAGGLVRNDGLHGLRVIRSVRIPQGRILQLKLLTSRRRIAARLWRRRRRLMMLLLVVIMRRSIHHGAATVGKRRRRRSLL